MHITEIKQGGEGGTLTIQDDSPDYSIVVKISDNHEQDCCERVFADWENMKYYPERPLPDANVDVKTLELVGDPRKPDFIEPVEGLGFKMKVKDADGGDGYILVECYNRQNGYYSSDLELLCTTDDKWPGDRDSDWAVEIDKQLAERYGENFKKVRYVGKNEYMELYKHPNHFWWKDITEAVKDEID
jgi:hypothetical protein